jgi:PiT family inorganic phosphate transporter
MLIILLCLVALLAFANGSNDNGKGVATLVGFGAARPLPALAYATAATAAGGVVSFWLAGGLLKGFSTGLFAAGTPIDNSLFVCVLVGACAWVLFASRFGMPISTTHAIVGALCGAGVVSFGAAKVRWSFLGASFAVPLAVSPVLSLAVVYVVAWPVGYVVARVAGRCVCVVETAPAMAPAMAGVGAAGDVGTGVPAVVVDYESNCPPEDRVAAATASGVAMGVHWISGGLISFARGWNDTPKIAALSLFALASVNHGTAIGFAVVTAAMAVGGMLAGRKVLDTLSKKLTPLPLSESLTASLTTAALVLTASRFALPVSTTHVATGAIIGAGLKNDTASIKWSKVGEIVLSWLVTLPVAGLIAAGARVVIR